jgi:AcrR family transcriptional regulator
MGRRPGPSLSVEDVVREATREVERVGVDALTLKAVADALGVRPPALYHHVRDRSALLRLVAVAGWTRLWREMPPPTADARASMVAWAEAWRRFGRERRELYRAMNLIPVGTDDPEFLELAQSVMATLVLGGVDPATVLDALRSVRAGVQGFIEIERATPDLTRASVDASFRWMLDALLDAAGVRPRSGG